MTISSITANKKIAFGLLASLLLTPSFGSQEPISVITYLSWYLPFGTRVGCDKWRQGGAGYTHSIASGINHPLRSKQFRATNSLSPIPYSLTTEAAEIIKGDLTDIRDAGFDVVAYDMLPNPTPTYSKTSTPSYCGLDLFERFGQIAQSVGLEMALFSDLKNLSADFPKGYYFNSQEWENAYSIINDRFGQKSWYWRPRGVPAIFQFGATEGAFNGLKSSLALNEWARLQSSMEKKGKKIDLILDVRPRDYEHLKQDTELKGLLTFLFAPAAPYKFSNKFLTDLSAISQYPIWSANPGYYNRELKIHLPPDFARIHEAYMAAIQSKAKVMLFATWNDFEEDTDILPSQNKGKALIHILKYYNSWFKSGQRPIASSPTMVFAVPRFRFSEVISAPPSWGGGASESEGDSTGQIIYYWTNAESATWMDINGKRIRLQPGVNIGSHKLHGENLVTIKTPYGEDRIHRIDTRTRESSSMDKDGRDFVYDLVTGK